MSTLGKIFSFIVLVCAVAFVSAAYVYTEEAKNWKGDFEKMMADWKIPQPELRPGDKTIEQLNNEVAKLTQDLAKANEQREMHQKKADDALVTIGLRDTEIQKLRGEITELQTSEKRLKDDVASIKTELKNLRDENQRLATEKEQARKDKIAAEQAMRKAQDELAACQDDLNNYRNQVLGLKRDLKTSMDLNKRYDDVFGEEGKRLAEATKGPQPKINGLVKQADNKAGIILISVGKGDGVGTGMTFEVVRGTRYVGEIRVTDVYDEEAVCRVVVAKTRIAIQEGDYVTTRLQ